MAIEKILKANGSKLSVVTKKMEEEMHKKKRKKNLNHAWNQSTLLDENNVFSPVDKKQLLNL